VPRPAIAREDPRRAQALRLVLEGRCAAALEVLARLVRDRPDDPGPLAWTAECEIDRGNAAAARAALDRAVVLAPEDGEIRLLLAITLYQQEEFARSSEELERAARALGEDRAEIALYRGLLLLTRAETEASRDGAAWLERARVLDASAVEPMASYYAGLGWSSAEDVARARVALERVVAEWPGTEWAQQAERLLADLDAKRQRFFGSLRAGVEWDSNAVLQGQGSALPDEISSQRDFRGVWQGQLGAELFRRGPWSLGASASYSGVAYAQIESFDSNFPGFAIWLDRSLDDATTLRLLLDTGYAWVDGDSFLWTYRGSLSVIRQWTELGTTEAYARFWRDDFYVQSDDVPDGDACNPFEACGPPGLDERSARNRDGNAFAVGFVQTTPLPVDWPFGQIEANAGYQFEYYSTRGREYTYRAHTIAGSVRADLPWRLEVEVTGGFTWRPYRHPTTFPNPPIFAGVPYALPNSDRDETTGVAGVALERPITDWLAAGVSWRYERNVSNAQAFDYEREIVGAYLTATFGH
jgi:tetratricopeptide (TPR) repeat protein